MSKKYRVMFFIVNSISYSEELYSFMYIQIYILCSYVFDLFLELFTLKYYVFFSLPCLQDQISPEMVKEMSKLRALMVRKTASKRGTKKMVPTALPPSLRPSLTPHFALCDVPYEFNEPISAINTVLEAWGVP